MSKSILTISIFIMLTFQACNKEYEVRQNEHPTWLRSQSDISLEVTLCDESKIQTTTTYFTIQSISASEFYIIINPGSGYAQAHYCKEVNAVHNDQGLKITANAGTNQTIYDQKMNLNVKPQANGQLKLSIDNGSIVSVVTSLIGDESEGF